MPEAPKKVEQDPNQGAHVRLPGEVERLKRHIEHFVGAGDEVEANNYRERLKHTEDRLRHALRAKPLVDALGFGHEVTRDKITYNDALNFVAKTLHEIQHGTKTSNYTRANHSTVNDGKHIDLERHVAPRDEAADVIEHLGLTDPKQVALVNKFFGKAA